jgi:hypothetical protein
MATEEEGKRGFRVQDRRRFMSTGEESSAAETVDQTPEPPVEAKTETSPYPEAGRRPDSPFTAAAAEITFSSFVLGLSTQTLMYLGEIPPAPGQSKQTDLPAAQQMIEVLSMLREKTKGNLDPGEETMLGNALFDLRMRYVELVRQNR